MVVSIAVVHCDVTSRRRDVTDSVFVCGFVDKVYNKLKCYKSI